MKKRAKKYNARNAKVRTLASSVHVAFENMFIVKSSISKLEVRGLEKLAFRVKGDDLTMVLKGVLEDILLHERKWKISIAIWEKAEVDYSVNILDLKLDEHTVKDFSENLKIVLTDHIATDNICGYLLVAAPNNTYDLYDTIDRNIDVFGDKIVTAYENNGFEFEKEIVDIYKLIDEINFPDPNNYTIVNAIK